MYDQRFDPENKTPSSVIKPNAGGTAIQCRVSAHKPSRKVRVIVTEDDAKLLCRALEGAQGRSIEDTEVMAVYRKMFIAALGLLP